MYIGTNQGISSHSASEASIRFIDIADFSILLADIDSTSRNRIRYPLAANAAGGGFATTGWRIRDMRVADSRVADSRVADSRVADARRWLE